jgi:uncharacterized protein DUF6958
MAARKSEKIRVENPHHPGQARYVDAGMYEAMRRAYLAALPRSSSALTLAEIQARAVRRLPEGLFPGGARAGWWVKTVQLDLEAKGMLARERTTPLRLRRA